MSTMPKRTSFADIAVNAALILMSAAAAVLLCIYLLGGRADNSSADSGAPHVINASETEPVRTSVTEAMETTVVSEEPAVSETETEPEPEPEIGVYSPAFFEKALFIGDSLSVGLINYEFLPPENVFAKAGITPSLASATVIDDISVFDKARSVDPEYICIMLGTNGIAYVEGQQMSEELGDFIDMIAKTCPNAKIAIASVPPITQKHEAEKPEQLEAIIAYNGFVKQLAEEKSVAFADVFSLLEDETSYLGSRYAEHDGLHLKIHAYPVILGAFQTALIEYYGVEFMPPPELPETEAVSAAVSAGTVVFVPSETGAASDTETLPEAEELSSDSLSDPDILSDTGVSTDTGVSSDTDGLEDADELPDGE
ncbi:MAG: GDSL-type esterase/lipase family protein [Prevotella sp.]|nr:GDSL-type esterase/lipase family protein [Prevotella sp.]